MPSSAVPPPRAPTAPVRPGAAATAGLRGEEGLSWDDDELETQIYDNPEDDPRNQPKPGHAEIPRAAARPGNASGKQASIPLSWRCGNRRPARRHRTTRRSWHSSYNSTTKRTIRASS